MKNLFLASSFAEVADIFESTQAGSLQGKSVTFIPTASIHEAVNFYVEDAKNAFLAMGMQVDILDLSSTSADVIAATLEKNDFIYVSGGNTFYLLQELKRTAADVGIIKQVNQGKTYIGESAGAMITSANIEYVKDMDDDSAGKDLSSYEALNLIDFFPIPHYKNEPFQQITAAMVAKYSDRLNIKPFSNNEAFRVQNDELIRY